MLLNVRSHSDIAQKNAFLGSLHIYLEAVFVCFMMIVQMYEGC